EEFYEAVARRGLGLGPAFQGIAELWRGDGEALGRLEARASDSRFRIHPSFLDATFQPLIAAASGDLSDTRQFLPIGIRKLELCAGPPARAWSWARVVERRSGGVVGEVMLFDEEGVPLLAIEGLECRVLEAAAARERDDALYEYAWAETPGAAPRVSTAGVA